MADAYCGPSNALQTFKQHTSVDRTLQQDRLISRQQPGQTFRSHDPTTGALDADFEAFQSQQPSSFAGPAFFPVDQSQHLHPNQHSQHLHPNQYSQHLPLLQQRHIPSPALAGPSQAPSWATDFSNLHISPQHASQHHNTQNPTWANAFHHSSGKSPAHSTYLPSPSQYASQSMYSLNQPWQHQSPLQQPQHNLFLQPTQQPQTSQSSAPNLDFDDAAFDAAFDAAMEDARNTTYKPSDPDDHHETPALAEISPNLGDHISDIRIQLLRGIMTNTKPSLYLTSLFLYALDKYDVAGNFDPDQAIFMVPLIDRLADTSRTQFGDTYRSHDMGVILNRLQHQFKGLEKHAHITPDSEQLLAAYADCLWAPVARQDPASDDSVAIRDLTRLFERWGEGSSDSLVLDLLQQPNILERYGFPRESSESMLRVRELEKPFSRDQQVQQVNEHDGLLFQAPEADQQVSTMLNELREQLDQSSKDDDELANTAAELLNKVSHDKSTKFQNSAFLGLMRKLADRQVKVEGDKMVETNSTSGFVNVDVSEPSTTAVPSTWSNATSQAPFAGPMHPSDNYHDYNDGQEVVNLLNMPSEMELPSAADINNSNQDSAEFLMTSPFADAGDY